MVDEWDGSNEDAVGLEAEEGGSPQEVADLEGGEVLISVRAGNGGAGSGSSDLACGAGSTRFPRLCARTEAAKFPDATAAARPGALGQ